MTGDRAGLDGLVATWPGDRHAVVAVDRSGPLRWWGEPDAVFGLASVSKALAATAVWVAVEEGTLSLDAPVAVDGVDPAVTLRHLLSHASGLGPNPGDPSVPPGTRRIYSNAGFELIDHLLATASGFTTAEYLRRGVFDPLGMSASALRGSAAHGAFGSARDLARWVVSLLEASLVHRDTLDDSTSVQFPELSGVLPGFGVQRPNPWGLGVEIRGTKSPHWTAPDNDPRTFGHFGRSGTFVWVDPVAGLGLVGLGGVDFDVWAIDLWPRLSAAVLAEFRAGRL